MLDLVIIDYTNWRGERCNRLICPYGIFWGKNEWHPEEQWLLEARDYRSQETRAFAMKQIHSWLPLTEEQMASWCADGQVE